MITGGIEVGETTQEAVVRELKEETGITKAKLYVIPMVNSYYLSAVDKVCLSPVFLCEAKNKDVKISDEHSEYKWVSFEEAKELIHWHNQVESMCVIEEFLNNEKKFKKLVELEK